MRNIGNLKSKVKRSVTRYFEVNAKKPFSAFNPNVCEEKPHEQLRLELFELINYEFEKWEQQEQGETNKKLAAIYCKIAEKSPELIKWKDDIKS